MDQRIDKSLGLTSRLKIYGHSAKKLGTSFTVGRQKNRDYFCRTDQSVACNEMNKMSAIFTIREYTCILKRGAIYGCNLANYDCRLASNKQLRC